MDLINIFFNRTYITLNQLVGDDDKTKSLADNIEAKIKAVIEPILTVLLALVAIGFMIFFIRNLGLLMRENDPQRRHAIIIAIGWQLLAVILALSVNILMNLLWTVNGGKDIIPT